MRRLFLGLAGAAMAFGAIAAQPAAAQNVSVSVRTGYGYGHGYGDHWHGHHRPYPVYREPVYYGRPVYGGPVYGGPVYGRPVYHGPRCVTRISERWNGYGWVEVRRRICH